MSKDAAKPAAASAAAGAEDGEAPAPKKKRALLRGGVILLALVAVLGAGGWFLSPWLPAWARLSKPEAKPEVKREPPIKITVPVGSLVVNLGRPESRRYLKIAVELGVTAAKHGKEVEEHKSQITDLLISVLAATPVETLSDEEGRAEVKKDLLGKIREDLHLEGVRRVYFTEFVIQ